MTDVININGREYRLIATAYTPYLYKKLTGKDIFREAFGNSSTEEQFEFIKRLFHCEYLQGKYSFKELTEYLKNNTKEEILMDFFEFINEVDDKFFMNKDNTLRIISVWTGTQKTESNAKNLESPLPEN